LRAQFNRSPASEFLIFLEIKNTEQAATEGFFSPHVPR
jgi:hypothetical protein